MAGFLALWSVASEKCVGNRKFTGEICSLHSPDMVFDLYIKMETYLPYFFGRLSKDSLYIEMETRLLEEEDAFMVRV